MVPLPMPMLTCVRQIAHWVADSVLDKEDSRKRALVIKHFISVAEVSKVTFGCFVGN